MLIINAFDGETTEHFPAPTMIELGLALGLKKRIYIFGDVEFKYPMLMKNLSSVSIDEIDVKKQVKMVRGSGINEVVDYIQSQSLEEFMPLSIKP